MRNYAGTCKGICSYNLMYKILIQLLPLKSSVFVVHFSSTFWHWNKAFPQVSSQNVVVPVLLIFPMPYSKYRGVKICFYSCRYQNQNFSLVSRSCRSCSTRVELVSLVSHSDSSCCTCVARVWHSCCKLDQIIFKSIFDYFFNFMFEISIFEYKRSYSF